MSKTPATPKGLEGRAEAVLVGVLLKQPVPKFLPASKGAFCEACLRVPAAGEFTVRCTGELAEKMGETAAGSGLEIKGTLCHDIWTTGWEAQHKRLAIQAGHVKVIAPPAHQQEVGQVS